MEEIIYLSPSDQDGNAYAYGNTNEMVQCCRIADACEVALKRCGFKVYNNQADTMEERVAESNRVGAALHMPIHTNGFNGVVAGTRIMSYDLSGEGYKASVAVLNALAPVTPGTSENVSARPGLYEIRYANAPTVYVEAEFHDVPKIAKWIIENVVLIGEAIAKGVCAYFDVPYIEPAQKQEGETLYRVQVGAFRNPENAGNMQEDLKKAGFDGFIVKGKL
jgi:N-acetylmuramoyl-L-alanine amidase